MANDEWPSSSPVLNPLDYSIWGYLEVRVNAKPYHSLALLKQKLIKGRGDYQWIMYGLSLIVDAVD